MRTAIVVGAGVAGLATAGALSRTGWRVTLLERDERLRPGRAAVVLWPNGVRALRALGLAGGLDSVATPVPPLGVRRPDGQWLVSPEQVRATGDDPPVVLHRENLHDLLVAGLGDQIDIRTNILVRTVRSTAERPAVGDGRTIFEADLVVGADGVDSTVRRRLAPGSGYMTAGYAAWRALIPWYRVPELPPDGAVGGELLGAGHGFVHMMLGEPGGPGGALRAGVYWAATAPGAPRPEPPETQLGLLRRWFAAWPAPVPQLLAATAPEDLVQHGVGELRPLPPVLAFPAGAGGYALAGDAGHAMAHHLGQGACLALEDAVTLQRALHAAAPGPTLHTALDGYSRARRPRLVKVATASRRVTALVHGRGGFGARARNLAVGRSLPRSLERAVSEIGDWYPPTG